MTKTTTRRDGPGLKRLRASPAAETIRSAVLDDQRNGRAEALARIEAEKVEAAAFATAPSSPSRPAPGWRPPHRRNIPWRQLPRHALNHEPLVDIAGRLPCDSPPPCRANGRN